MLSSRIMKIKEFQAMSKSFQLVFATLCMLAMAGCDLIGEPQCKIPEIALDDGKIIIGTKTYGAEVAYTIGWEGEEPPDPNTSSSVYTEPISLWGQPPAIVKAQAYKDGFRNSRIATKELDFEESAFIDTLNLPVVDSVMYW